MKARYVVDTNVLIAASAVFPLSGSAAIATPTDPELRQRVHDWLLEYKMSDTRMVLDSEGKIQDEYKKNMGFNDFGLQVVIHKYSTCAVDLVDVLYDDDGNGFLNEPLATVVHDLSDRKMIAAALETVVLPQGCAIANSGDTDWYDWVIPLLLVDIEVEQIIEDWTLAMWIRKKRESEM